MRHCEACRRRRCVQTKNGPVVDGEGWFVVNTRNTRWRDVGPLGAYCNFEGKRRLPPLGININVLGPGPADRDVPPRERGRRPSWSWPASARLNESRDGERPPGRVGLLLLRPAARRTSSSRPKEQSAVVLAVGGRGRGVGGGLRLHS